MNLHDPEKLKQVMIWIGVANQLNTTRFNQLMAEYNLPLPQFTMLNHFRRDPHQGRTITQLASAFQKGYLEVQVSKEDKRVKYHYITKAGLDAHKQAIALILPDAQLIFAEWSSEEVDSLHKSLFRLKNWLDDHRDTLENNNCEV
jgi:DNA-binding MarR family transcriptional regulator